MDKLPEDIQRQLEILCEHHHVVLLEIILRGTRERRVVEMYVDSPEGITLDKCSELSTLIGEFCDTHAVFGSSYRLDVSSPGVGRPLQFLWQYTRNIGRLTTVTLNDGTILKGRIIGVENSSVLIEPPRSEKRSKKAAPDEAKIEQSNAPAAVRTIAHEHIKTSVIEIEL